MKKQIFYDTEFIENKGSLELISIGMVDSEGNEYYGISSEFDESKASDWVKENVLSKLEKEGRKPEEVIAKEILEFLGEEEVDLWAYYSAYDHVVLMWLYGIMVDKPKQLPMFTYDLYEIICMRGLKKLKSPEGEHNALEDAKWNFKLWKHIGSPIPEVSREKNGSVFLGGTCNGSTWRQGLINKFPNSVKYFDPVVEDWDEEAQAEEDKQREESVVNLFTITPKMTGVFSIAEVVDCSNKRPRSTLLSILVEDGSEKFDKFQLKSLIQVGKLVQKNGGRVAPSIESLEEKLKDLN